MRVAVVGAGVMGAAAAWQLADRGAAVTLLDRYPAGHTLGSSHGTGRIFRLAYADPFYVELAVRSLDLWRAVERRTGRALLRLPGALDHGPAELITQLHDALVRAGRPARQLTPADAARRWPGLRFDTAVLFHPDGGQVHADHAVAALASGIEVRRPCRVVAVDGVDPVVVTTAAGERIEADRVVLAAGSWAPTLSDGLPPLVVTQEQPVHFPPRDGDPGWPSFIHHPGAEWDGAFGMYGLGGPDGVKVGAHGRGAVVDPDRRSPGTDPDALAEVVDYTARWLPGLDAERPEPSTCLYTMTPDHDFVVDRQGPVTVLAGFSGHGFKFAPAIGALAADLVLDDAAPPPRFAAGRTYVPVGTQLPVGRRA